MSRRWSINFSLGVDGKWNGKVLELEIDSYVYILFFIFWLVFIIFMGKIIRSFSKEIN